MAYRGILRLGFHSNSTTMMIGDATATPPTYPTVPSMVEDKYTMSSHFIGLGAGMEWRRGKTRLQGFYGADAMIWLAGSKDKYTYGNALATGTTPVAVNAATTSNFGSNFTTDTYGNTARVTEMSYGKTFGIGVRGFIGCEYFIVPKISIGAEFGWGIGYSMNGTGDTDIESNNGTTVGSQKLESGKSSSLVLDTDRNVFGTANGSLRMNFHF